MSLSTMKRRRSLATKLWEQQDIDRLFTRGRAHILPRLYPSRLKVFQDTQEKALDDPAMPPLIEEPPAKRAKTIQEINKEKLERSADRQKGEEAEIKVLEMLQSALEATTGPNDLPCFLLNDLDENTHETDAIILHPDIGVVVLEIKGASNPKNLAQLVKATKQLIKGEEKVYEKLKDLLPAGVYEEKKKVYEKLKDLPTGATEVKKKVCEKLKDLPAGAVFQVVCLPNLEEKDLEASDKMKEIREMNPTVKFLFGKEAIVYQQWLAELKTQDMPAPWVHPDEDVDATFKKAVERYLQEIRPCSPASALTKLAAAHQTWILTPDQVAVRDRQDRLLHIWGPPGAGKTLLLIRKARKWMEGGGAVLLNVGKMDYDVLLSHLGRAVLHDKVAGLTSRLRFCVEFPDIGTGIEEMLTANKGMKPDQICVITDELRFGSFKTLVKVTKLWTEVVFWTASVSDLSDISNTQTKQAEDLGWERVEVKQSIRCPKYVVELLNKLVVASISKWHAPVQSYPVLPALVFTRPAVIRHPCHPEFSPLEEAQPRLACAHCRQELKEALEPLGQGTWPHTVVLGTGELGHVPKVQDEVVALLREAGMPVVWEQRKARSNVVQAGSQDDDDAWRRRVVAGEDESGQPAVHGLEVEDFHGLEKPLVLVVHWDPLDDDPDFQEEDFRKSRQAEHVDQWMTAISRCQGQLILLILSPSPACNLLDSPPPSPLADTTPTPSRLLTPQMSDVGSRE